LPSARRIANNIALSIVWECTCMDLPPLGNPPRRQLSQDVASYVRELIISGRVREGEFLRIDSIAKAMDISSTPVREGLLLLQLEGFVRLSPRRGFQVVGFSRQDVRDIFWAQAVLAGELAARAAEVIDDNELLAMEQLLREHAKAIKAGDEPRYTRLGHQFHRAVNLAARSPRLAILLGGMTKQLPNRFYGMMESQVEGTLDYHPRILAALKAHKPDAARALMSEHLVKGGEFLVEGLEGKGVWSEST
jgi:DNA-binding GntR family transcriptional regulator